MLLFWFFLIIFICSVLSSILSKTEKQLSISAVIAFITFIGTFSTGIFWNDAKYTVEKDLIKYEKTEALVRAAESGMEIKLSVYNNILDDVECVNETIEKNKRLLNSPWRGKLYSEKIANLEPLTIDKTNLNVNYE